MSNKQKTLYSEKPDMVPPGRALKQCHCGTWFSLPACHADRHRSCSDKCKLLNVARRKAASAETRRRNCGTCGKPFVPRQWQIDVGGGRFCSHVCASKDVSSRDSWRAAMPMRVESVKRAIAEGRFPVKRGPDNPKWNGGPAATTERWIKSGKAKQSLAKYRAANREKVREWSKRRNSGKIARLPRGTIPALFEKQRGRCAFCKTDLPSNYHVDHIIPLAAGGKHEPLNLQLLCPTCNVRKWALHPVEFAQRNGRLL